MCSRASACRANRRLIKATNHRLPARRSAAFRRLLPVLEGHRRRLEAQTRVCSFSLTSPIDFIPKLRMSSRSCSVGRHLARCAGHLTPEAVWATLRQVEISIGRPSRGWSPRPPGLDRPERLRLCWALSSRQAEKLHQSNRRKPPHHAEDGGLGHVQNELVSPCAVPRVASLTCSSPEAPGVDGIDRNTANLIGICLFI